MKKLVIVLCACAAVAGAVRADDSGYPRLDAEYTVIGNHLVDPAPNDKKDRVAIYIKGDSARQIYKAMLAPERFEECDGTPRPAGSASKTAGGLMCEGSDKGGYTCSVAIMLDSGKTVSGVVCN